MEHVPSQPFREGLVLLISVHDGGGYIVPHRLLLQASAKNCLASITTVALKIGRIHIKNHFIYDFGAWL